MIIKVFTTLSSHSPRHLQLILKSTRAVSNCSNPSNHDTVESSFESNNSNNEFHGSSQNIDTPEIRLLYNDWQDDFCICYKPPGIINLFF